ncbi:hypothetical protein P4H83_06960 [Paenibacillus favisporus]|uniref:hypothetical protein n=1 Tax=Paenibacillus favisporus TaxID=221028 RepID=UPI002DB9F167|nr:hypothetical protein [Paenibacillus favisporus]MEC0174610.1 hypothetical protein [Paenibacillus favisporus]
MEMFTVITKSAPSINAPLDETVSAQRPITVRDLLTFTMGFGLMFTPTDEYPILSAAKFGDSLEGKTYMPRLRHYKLRGC